jgi:hypothetical protein
MIRGWKLRVIRRWLAGMNTAASYRMDSGDFDFDDTVYRTREATAVLLEIYWGEER